MELNNLTTTSLLQRRSTRSGERMPLDNINIKPRRNSMKNLVRQASTVNTQRTPDGTMQLTYWF